MQRKFVELAIFRFFCSNSTLFLRDSSSQQFGGNTRPQDEVLVAQIANPKDQTQAPVAQRYNRILREDDRLGATAGTRQLGEDEADHEGLDA